MWSRRAFLRSTGVLGATALTARTNGVEAIAEAAQSVGDRSAAEVAQDEFCSSGARSSSDSRWTGRSPT